MSPFLYSVQVKTLRLRVVGGFGGDFNRRVTLLLNAAGDLEHIKVGL